MKLLTKEQEQAHYRATLTGGLLGGGAGLAVGAVGVLAASRRYQFFRQLTLPLKAFLITSAGTFAGIVSADHYSRSYEREQNPIDMEYDERQRQQAQKAAEGKTFTERAMDFGKKERYKIVGASWIASMVAAFAIVNRNKFLTGQQKLVQARVYAQFLTLGVLVATAAFEIQDRKNETGRYETVTVLDPADPEHKRMMTKTRPVEESDGDTLWKDMVAAEEERLKEREAEEKRVRAHKHKKEGGASIDKKEGGGTADKAEKTADKKDQQSDNGKKNEKKDEGNNQEKGHHEQEKKANSANDAKNNDGDKSKNKEKNSKKDE